MPAPFDASGSASDDPTSDGKPSPVEVVDPLEHLGIITELGEYPATRMALDKSLEITWYLRSKDTPKPTF